MDDWDDLRYLLAVAGAGSIRGASRELGVDPATVSRRVIATAEYGVGTVDAVRAGMGIGVLPELVAEGLVRLASLPDDRGPDLWLLCPQSVRHRPAVGVVMDTLKGFGQAFPHSLVRSRSAVASA